MYNPNNKPQMKNILNFNNFINESLVNIAPELDSEIETLIDAILKNPECNQVDDGYLEITTPFELNPDAKNRDWVNKTGMVFYPELLAYGDPEAENKVRRTPWISCRVSIEGEKSDELVGNLLKWLVELIKKSGYTPFMDEDAKWNHWKEEKGNGWVEYSCYVNPSYPKGYWENHTLE